MVKTKIRIILANALVYTLLLSQGTCVFASDTKTDSSNVEAAQNVNTSSNVSVKATFNDDFYSAVNSEWLSTAKIRSGDTGTSTFGEIQDKITEQKREIIKELLANEKDYAENSTEKKIINLYKNYINMDERNKQEKKCVKEVINEIHNIKSVKDISNLSSDSKVSNVLLRTMCTTDLKDAANNAFYIGPTSLSLGDSGEYTKPTEQTNKTKSSIQNYYVKVLKLSGYSEDNAKAKVDNLFKFEGMIAPYIKSREEYLKDENDAENSYNVYTLEQLDKLAPNLDIKALAKNLKIENVKEVILTEPKFLEGLNKIYTDENLELLKDYIEINNIVEMISWLGQDFLDVRTEYQNGYTGAEGDISLEEKAINIVDSALGEALGKIYVEKYCSKKTKENITEMTETLINAYKERIQKLDWMSDATKEKAIEKLDKMTLKIAYPEKLEDYSNVEIRSFEEGGSLAENMRNLINFEYEKSINRLNESVDKTKFERTPQTVNAFYDPNTNSITVPAGILQGDFYNESFSKEKNLAGIGTIIGHEISHAFDTSGSKYDADGNLNDWWTEEDYNKFKEKTDKVKAYYSNVKADNGQNVNGELTLTENIADIGGVAGALDVLNKMDNPNYKEFFESNAKIWREITTPEYAQIRLTRNAHSPHKVRVNVVLAQFDEFYETYGIKPGDKMYVKPQDRLKIW